MKLFTALTIIMLITSTYAIDGLRQSDRVAIQTAYDILNEYDARRGFPIVCVKHNSRMAYALKKSNSGEDHFIIGNNPRSFSTSKGFVIKDFENTLQIKLPERARDISPDDFYLNDREGNLTAITIAETKYGDLLQYFCVYKVTSEIFEMRNNLSGKNSINYVENIL